MSLYKKSFALNVKDIDLIEKTVREKIGTLSRRLVASGEPQSEEDKAIEADIRDLAALLGKIHNQKIFYGQAHHTGAPISG